ncbi:MAG: LysE family translocator [Campylobacterales bacterium]|nr:LysE family translocator [Campylobacterales bacterium]
MMNSATLMIFIPTFIAVSVTPGMCMTLAMTLGMSVGLKRTLWMMAGELVGVAVVSVCSVVGVAVVMVRYPEFFTVFKWVGGIYLFYLGVQLWRSRGKMSLSAHKGVARIPPVTLMIQGFVTAVANPKGWAFFIALLPPFIAYERPIVGQLVVLVGMILVIEFCSLLLYALGGSSLRALLQQEAHVKLLNRIAGVLMMGVGVWLALG